MNDKYKCPEQQKDRYCFLFDKECPYKDPRNCEDYCLIKMREGQSTFCDFLPKNLERKI